MKFEAGERYWSDDGGRDMVVHKRLEYSGMIRAVVGMGLPANYKVRTTTKGREWIKAKGYVFEA